MTNDDDEQIRKRQEGIQRYQRIGQEIDEYESVSGPELLLPPTHFHYAATVTTTTTNTSRVSQPVGNNNQFAVSGITVNNYLWNGNRCNTNAEHKKLQQRYCKKKRKRHVSTDNNENLHSAIFAVGLLRSEFVFEQMMEKDNNLRSLHMPKIHSYLDRYRNTYSDIQQQTSKQALCIQNTTKNNNFNLNNTGALVIPNSAVCKVSDSKNISRISPYYKTLLSDSISNHNPIYTNTRYNSSAEHQQTRSRFDNSVLVRSDSSSPVEETVDNDVFIMPQLTEKEKKSSIGASLAFLMGLYFTMLQELEEKRKDHPSIGAGGTAGKILASDSSIPKDIDHVDHLNHFRMNDQELQTMPSIRKDSIDSIDVSVWTNCTDNEGREGGPENLDENIPSAHSLLVSSAVSVCHNKDLKNDRSRILLTNDQQSQAVQSTRKNSLDSIDISIWSNLTDEGRECVPESHEDIPSHSLLVSSSSSFSKKNLDDRSSRIQGKKWNSTCKSRCNSFMEAFDNEDTH